MIPCPLFQLTGYQCPFCGVQRGIMALLEGDIATWWNYNPVVWCLMPYFVVLVMGEIYKPWREHRLIKGCYSNKAIFTVMGLLLLWGVIRNLI